MTDANKTPSIKLESAPLEMKIAVDLIQLLEQNNLPLETTITALEIVLKDFKNKRNK